MSSQKPKKIVITPEEVASTPTRKGIGRKTAPSQVQVIELAPNAVTDSVAFVQVNENGVLSSIDGLNLDQQDIAIQIDDSAANELEGTIALHAEGAQAEEPSIYSIQSAETYRREILVFIQENLLRNSEKYADLAIFCSDGIVWSSKLVLASASTFLKEILLSIPNQDDTCLVMPHMTKREFLTFQEAIFAPEESQPNDMFPVIKGCELLCIDLEEKLQIQYNSIEDAPIVEYANMLANPFEKKRVLKSLGYINTDGFSEGMMNVEGSDIIKDIGPVLKVLEDNIKCEQCNRNFYDHISLDKHMKLMHSTYTIDKLVKNSKEKYSCSICSATFAYAVNVKKHFWLTHSVTGGDLRLKGVQGVPVSIPVPTKEDKLNEKYEDMKCSICGKYSTNWKALQLHMLAHANKNPYKCESCGKGFRDDQKLKRHMVVHTKEKNFECSFCGKRFGLKQNMKVHEKIHRGQGKKCEYCPRTFTNNKILNNHYEKHKDLEHEKTLDPEMQKMQLIQSKQGRPSTAFIESMMDE